MLEILVLALFASFFPVLRRAARQLGSHIDEIEHLALHDSLTGLPNRVLFRDRVDQVLEDARRHAGRAAVMLLDLDRFKEINDVLGHANGDELLRAFSDRLRRSLRDCDTVARLGGDEFGIVMRVDGVADVRAAADRIHEALAPPFAIGDLSLDVGASIGAALFPDDALDPETLVRFADVAMYTSKRNRTRIELYDPAEDDSSRDALALGGEVRQALEDGSIVAHFQPKVEVETGRVVGAEALARWHHAERGIVPPGAFLPLVEKAGLMRLLTTRILGLAVEQAAAWHRAGTPIEVAVNIDIRALLDPGFPSRVEEILDEAGLPPGLLTLEITETSLMADPTRARGVADELAAIGVRLSIDDFGTGYSSLGHLTALPLSELKIDRSFVSRMAGSPTDMTIVKTILDLGASLGLSIVAEGIESKETAELLSGLGCRLAQGYELGRPVPAAALTAAIRAPHRAGRDTQHRRGLSLARPAALALSLGIPESFEAAWRPGQQTPKEPPRRRRPGQLRRRGRPAGEGDHVSTAADHLRALMDQRIAILDGSDVGEPVVPPRAASFSAVHPSLALGLPLGEARLRPRRRVPRVTGPVVNR